MAQSLMRIFRILWPIVRSRRCLSGNGVAFAYDSIQLARTIADLESTPVTLPKRSGTEPWIGSGGSEGEEINLSQEK
ncbi:hypothetical protein GXN76_09055 [Kroppenstedtia pulmonis]|uniref:Uncharacterized protein n=1 Tax=Kroppenstedtia pulmonis TaxID=1380685 RepID=A0A7D4BFU2_9BACL|nr:hypothetical protein [Kroppenstedtia pulmonis]QKG84612.1 hypothetical protein GXN76_09055 [Kroppenstedtia pulmonis]